MATEETAGFPAGDQILADWADPAALADQGILRT